MHLRMEFDFGVGPTCRFYIVAAFESGEGLVVSQQMLIEI